jgi:hypothetical protein
MFDGVLDPHGERWLVLDRISTAQLRVLYQRLQVPEPQSPWRPYDWLPTMLIVFTRWSLGCQDWNESGHRN